MEGIAIMEIAPGVHRISFAIDTKPMAIYIIEGDTLTLIDTGIASTPAEVYLPAIMDIGHKVEDVGLILITHADADHIGGNHAARKLFPNASFACHSNDQRWASDPAVIMEERYDGFASFGLRYDQAVFDVLASWMGPAEPMDMLLRGGERIRRTGDEWLTVLHVPGHTPGHICLFSPDHRYAIIGDAIFGRSQIDTAGNWSAPPPYTSVDSYRTTIQTIAALNLDLLLTCHYPVMRGQEIRQFVDASSQFIDVATEVTRQILRDSSGPVTLGEAIAGANPLLGPFAFADDLQFALLAHLDHEVQHGRAMRQTTDQTIAWMATR